MKTLVIHPDDRSTDFLKVIYKGMKDTTVLTGNGVTQDELRTIIPDYDRVMIMGHGSPYGLFTMGGFVSKRGYLIDETFVDVLKNNPNNVYIWCHADVFVNRYSLIGFHSGMFISEVGEAYHCGLKKVTQKMVDESNYGFCEILKKYRTKKPTTMYRCVKKHYEKLSVTNPIANYNSNRIYLKQNFYGTN